MHAAAKQNSELVLQVRIYKFRLKEEKTEKERFQAKFAEASTATTREKREKKELTKAMEELRRKMEAMQVDMQADIEVMQDLKDEEQRKLKREMQLEFDKERKACEASYQRHEADNERFHEESLTAKDETIKMLEDQMKSLKAAKGETIEMLEDEIKFFKSAKGAMATQSAFDRLEMASSAGLWSN